MYIERIDNHVEEAGRFGLGEKKKGVIFFSGKYISFMNDLDPEVLLNREQAQVFFSEGKEVFEEWGRKQNKKVEDKVIFNLLFQMVLAEGGKFEIFCYKPASILPALPYCFYREGKSTEGCKILQEGDIIALSAGHDLDFPASIGPDKKSLSEFIIFEIKAASPLSGSITDTSETATEIKAVRHKKNYLGRILIGILIFLLAGGGYVYLGNRGGESPTKQNEALKTGRSAAAIMNDIDQDLTLIDRRIAEGEYLLASEVIEKWRVYLTRNPEIRNSEDTAFQRRIRELDHFKSLLTVSDDDEL